MLNFQVQNEYDRATQISNIKKERIRPLFYAEKSKKQRGNTGALLRPKVGETGAETSGKANIIELARF